jgi:hypothetical protein
MGWKSKLAAAFFGLLFLGSGLWPLGLLCILYLLLSFRQGRGGSGGARPRSPRISHRSILGLFLLMLSSLSASAGGAPSPFVFLSAGAVVLAWPALVRIFPAGELIPQSDSILLRSRHIPFIWCSLAEVKPGAEHFPRSVSSFVGTLIVFTETGRTYSLATCLAMGRREAEAKVLSRFEASSSVGRAGAYLLPLDSVASADVLRLKLSRVSLRSDDLVKSVTRVSGVLVLECGMGKVSRASAYETKSGNRPVLLPGKNGEVDGQPLTWEVLDEVGKRVRWPAPDEYSNLLDSMSATRGALLSERLKTIEGAEGGVSLQGLSGAEVRVTRPQLRAIVSIYS